MVHRKNELVNVLEKIDKESIREYNERLDILNNGKSVDVDMLQKYGLQIQTFSFTWDCNKKIELVSFIVGDGIFYQIDLCDCSVEYLDKEENVINNPSVSNVEDGLFATYEIVYNDNRTIYLSEKGELCMFSVEDDEGKVAIKNCGRTELDRDFRKYNVFENIKWVITNANFKYGEMYYENSIEFNLSGVYFEVDFLVLLSIQSQNNDIPCFICEGGVDTL